MSEYVTKKDRIIRDGQDLKDMFPNLKAKAVPKRVTSSRI